MPDAACPVDGHNVGHFGSAADGTAPSSVGLSFARLGMKWENWVCVLFVFVLGEHLKKFSGSARKGLSRCGVRVEVPQ